MTARPRRENSRVAVEQRVGADEDVDLAGLEPGRDPPALRGGRAVGQQRDADRAVGQQRALGRHRQPFEEAQGSEIVLLGEHLGRRHERALVAALHRDQQRRERDHRLAGADVALEQAVHRRGPAEIAGDLRERRALVARERERERGDEGVDERPVDAVADARLLGRERTLPRDQTDLHPQELVEDQASLRRAELGHRFRAMDRAQRGSPVDEITAVEDRLVQRVREPAHAAFRAARPTPSPATAR